MDLPKFAQYLLLGISLGGMYGLVAVGYSIVYGIVRLINQGHGMFFTLAGYLAMYGIFRFNLPLPLSLIVATVITMVVGHVTEKVAYKPLRDHPISGFTATLGVSVFLQHILILFFGATARAMYRPKVLDTVLHFGEISLPVIGVFVFAVTLVMFVILYYIVNKTKLGRAMRALSKDMMATELMGVDVNRVISFAFALSTFYAAVGAILYIVRFPSVDPYIGTMPALKAFIGAVIGGIGSLPGALLGAGSLGLLEVLIVGFFPTLSGWRDVFSYTILIVFLLIRPGGLFNVKVVEEKV